MMFGTTGRDMPFTYIIGEIGINHIGQMNIARELIYGAYEAGADAVKFQKRDIEATYTKKMLNTPYNSKNAFGRTYGVHRDYLEFSMDQYRELKKYAEEYGLDFIVTPWDEPSVDFLEELGVEIYKIASADLTNIPLITKIAKLERPIIISTGMGLIEHVDDAINAICKYHHDIAIMYCVSLYPSEFEDINLNMIQFYQDRYPDLTVGYSGHELGIAISTAAAVLGAKVIERHITIDRSMKGSDQSASLEIGSFRKMCRDIQITDGCLTKPPIKYYSLKEYELFKKLGKSLTANRDILPNQIITPDDIVLKSPGTGIIWPERDRVLYKRALRDIKQNTTIRIEDIEE